MAEPIDPHAALIYTMVLASAAEGDISDRELDAMTAMVQALPVFEGFDAARIGPIGRECGELLRQDDGLDLALGAIAAALRPSLRETAYALACDIIAVDAKASQNELRLLEMIRDRLEVDRLTAAAIERGAAVRHRRVERAQLR
jgi:tellurite resistance protein